MAATAGASAPLLRRRLKPGTLIIGLTPPAPGFEVGTFKGTTVINPKGMEVDSRQGDRRKLGLAKIEWYNQSSSRSPIAPAPSRTTSTSARRRSRRERSKNVDFSIPYIEADQGVMVRKGLSPLPKSIADLKELKLCAQAGTTGAAYIKVHIKPTKAALPEQDGDHVQELVRPGQCDAIVYDIPIIGSAARLRSRPGRPDRRPDRHPRAVRHRVPEGQQAARGSSTPSSRA